jgi:NAD(P)-dependent dehydrogenase (short-subunit alcohol dehydrogenase family)
MPLSDIKLSGKNALVTGGGRGIGRAIALALAEEGANIAMAARTQSEVEETARQVKALNRKALPLTMDVSDSAQVDQCIKQAIDDLGHIDILINNAGVYLNRPVAKLSEGEPSGASISKGTGPFTNEQWDLVQETNLTGPFYCCRAIGPHLMKLGSGRVINISSTASIGTTPYHAAYNASKAALDSLTRTLAREWAPFNITVNSIAPGSFHTAMVPELDDPEYAQVSARSIPLGRIGKLEELGLLAVYLASEAASYITGQVIFVDGGASL